MTQPPKRNHHYIPRLYLKGFIDSDHPGFLWVYERGRRYCPGRKPHKHHPYLQSIKHTGMERDFYAYRTVRGETDVDTFENLLERLEKPLDPVLHKVRDGHMITRSEKQLLAKYIVLMARRVPHYRTHAMPHWSAAIREVATSSSLRVQIEQETATLDPTDTVRRARLDLLRTLFDQTISKYAQELPREVLYNAMVRNGQVPMILSRMQWQFLHAPSSLTYVTSDNPVCVREHLGLLHENAELTIPLSSTIALLARWNSRVKDGVDEASHAAVIEINCRTIRAAMQQVYANRATDWFLSMFNRTDAMDHALRQDGDDSQ